MSRTAIAASLALTLALTFVPAPVARAQVDLQPVDPDATLVEELVVTARLPGPAWWRVMDGDTTVYVLGTPSIAPKRQAWNTVIFDRRLQGASQVILPFNGLKVRLAGAPGAAFSYLRLKSSKPFEEGLEGAARSRFVAARTKVGQPADHYKIRHPLAAGLTLINDYRDKTSLTTTDPTKLIAYLARRSKVRVVQRAYDLGPLLGQIARTPQSAGQTCLDEAMQDVEEGPGGVLAASRAWAEGDVMGALAAERTYERCLAATPGALAFDGRVKGDMVADITAALKTPGHAIAVVQLRPLLSQGGVLDRLRSAGFVVKTPGED